MKDPKDKICLALILSIVGLVIAIIAFMYYYIVFPEGNSQVKIISYPRIESYIPAEQSQEAAFEAEGDTLGSFDEEPYGVFVKSPAGAGLYKIYQTPDKGSRVIYNAQEGEEFMVNFELDDWYRVEIPEGGVGWLSKEDVKEVKEIVESE